MPSKKDSPAVEFVLHCQRCGHQWLRRNLAKLPRVCAKCNSPYWNQPRRQPSDNPEAAYQRARRAGNDEETSAALARMRGDRVRK